MIRKAFVAAIAALISLSTLAGTVASLPLALAMPFA